VGETRVDLQHLLEDLRDAYTGALEETILTEAVANALDSGAAHIRREESPPPAQPPPGTESPLDGHPARTGIAASAEALDTVAGRRQPARYGLLVQFESRPGGTELARLVDSTIWINDVHPAYVRALASRSLGYHTALALALLAVEAGDEHAFITQFLAHWGGAPEGHRVVGRRRVKKAADR
jgi:hypothetical protein